MFKSIDLLHLAEENAVYHSVEEGLTQYVEIPNILAKRAAAHYYISLIELMEKLAEAESYK